MNVTTSDKRQARKKLLKGEVFWIVIVLIWVLLLAPLQRGYDDRPSGHPPVSATPEETEEDAE